MDNFIIRTPRNSIVTSENAISPNQELSNEDNCSKKTNKNEENDCHNDSSNSPQRILCALADPKNYIPTNRLEKGSRVLKGPYQPKLSRYPRRKIGSRLRCFQYTWYERFNWLEYSIPSDSAFCFQCRFFSSKDSTSKGHSDPAFTKNGFTRWHKAQESFRSREKSVAHKLSTEAWNYFLNDKPVDGLLDVQNKVNISKQEEKRQNNRKNFERLLNIILCLVKGGGPLRGHNENSDSNEKGLFLDIVELISKYDSLLQKHITNGPKNAQYLSSKIQNDIILSIHNVVLKKIISSIQNKKNSIMADDTSDVGHHEQMSVVLRYFDDAVNTAKEIFVCIRRLYSVTSQSIFDELKAVISILNVKMDDIVSVCFDGASTMSEYTSGVQAKFKEQNDKIMYIHCYAHCLNLVLVDACCASKENRNLFDFFGTIQYLYSFIEVSCMRHAVLEKIAQNMGIVLKTLKSLSTTRWVCRAEAVAAVKHNYSAIVLALEEIIETTKIPDVRAKGRGLINQLKSFDFIIGLVIVDPILQIILKVSKSLQSSMLNLLSASSQVESLKSALISFSKRQYEIVISLCDKYDIRIPEIKRRKVSCKLEN